MDTWPVHPEPSFHQPLRYAQEAEWFLQKYNGHSWGNLICNKDAPRNERCNILILRTAKGGESFALNIPSKIDGCPHRLHEQRPSRATRLAEAISRLDEAERLVEAARLCIDSGSKLAGAEELLSLAAEAVGDVDDALSEDGGLLADAEALESEALVQRDTAVALADAAGYPADAPVEPSPLLDEASSRVREATRDARGARDRDRTKLMERARTIRSAIEDLRSGLG